MANDNLKGVRWADGEALTHGDLNDAQRFALARLMDQVLEKLVPGPGDFTQEQSSALQLTAEHGDNVPTNVHAYTLHGGQGYPRQGTANNKVQIAPGTLLQKVGARDGNESSLLAYTFTGTEEVTIADGDATHPRVDLVQMALEWEDGDAQPRDFEDAVTGALSSQNTDKKRRVKCTLSVKQGTPAASPDFPEPDAGCVVIASVVVPANYTGAAGFQYVDHATAAVLHDQRMPMGPVREYDVFPAQFMGVNTGWTLAAEKDAITAGNPNSFLFALCPGGGKIGRCVGVRITWGGKGNGGDFLFSFRHGPHPAGNSFTALNSTQCSNTVGSMLSLTCDYLLFQANHAAAVGPQLGFALGGALGPPVWTNGRRSVVPDLNEYQVQRKLAWAPSLTEDGTVIRMVTFLVAEGL